MANKTQIPRKHAAKKVTAAQEKKIEQIQKDMIEKGGKPVAWLTAKHEFFENEEESSKSNKVFLKHESSEVCKPKRACLSIKDAKLGVTMVISPEECMEIGIEPETTTRDAIDEIRKRIGLPNRAMKKQLKEAEE